MVNLNQVSTYPPSPPPPQTSVPPSPPTAVTGAPDVVPIFAGTMVFVAVVGAIALRVASNRARRFEQRS